MARGKAKKIAKPNKQEKSIKKRRRTKPRTIRYAVKSLPSPVAKEIQKLWVFCQIDDSYDGNLEEYIKAIRMKVQAQVDMMRTQRTALKAFRSALEDLD